MTYLLLVTPRVSLGGYIPETTHRIRLSRFEMQPSRLKAARNQKPLKKSKISLKMSVLRSFKVLAALNLKGRIPNQGNRFKWALPHL